MTHGYINNVLLVPEISANLLSIYQICHSGNGKTVEFSPNEVVIMILQVLLLSNNLIMLLDYINLSASSLPLLLLL